MVEKTLTRASTTINQDPFEKQFKRVTAKTRWGQLM